MATDYVSLRLPVGSIKKVYENYSYIVLVGATKNLRGFGFSCSNKMIHNGETIVKCEEPFDVVSFPCVTVVLKRDKEVTLKKGKNTVKFTGEQLAHYLKDCIKETAEKGSYSGDEIEQFYYKTMELSLMGDMLVEDFKQTISPNNEEKSVSQAPQTYTYRQVSDRPPEHIVKRIVKGIGNFFKVIGLGLIYSFLKMALLTFYLLSLLVGTVGNIIAGAGVIIAILFFIFGEVTEGLLFLGIGLFIAVIPYVAEVIVEFLDNFLDDFFESYL